MVHSFRSFSSLPTSLKWRSETQQRIFASQISSLLLHRTNWIPILRSEPRLRLPLQSSPSLFHRILARIRSQPETALRFFHWIQSNVSFQPDLRSRCLLLRTLVDSDLLELAKHLLEPILRSEPAPTVLDLAVRSASSDSPSSVLSFLLESYSLSRLIPNSLEAFKRIRALHCIPSPRSCNEFLSALCSSDRIGTAWVCYAAAVRTGFEPDRQTWHVLARLLCSEGKLERTVELLNLGFCGVSIYDLVIDCYCEKGDFTTAMWILNRMTENDLKPRFSTYASILNGGCKLGEITVINSILKAMIVSQSMPTIPFLDYNWVINRFCELEKTFAAEVFFKRARDVNFKLGKGLYANFIRLLSRKGRVKEAMEVYIIILQEGVEMNLNSCEVFLSGICKGEPSIEADRLLEDAIGRGFIPKSSDLSIYIASQCEKGRWREASELLNLVLEKGILLDAFCCCSLVKHYCANGLVDSAIALHDKMKQSGGCLDVTSYNALLETLFEERRIEEAICIFDYMREKKVLSSASFVVMISALCRGRELRKAMNLHDEMLKVGLKPDDATYRRLITGFV